MRLSGQLYLSVIVGVFTFHCTLFGSWQGINLPVESSDYYLIDATAANDFWVSDVQGNLYHRNGTRWDILPGPPLKGNRFRFFKLNTSEFLGVATDSLYQSHFYRYQSGHWKPLQPDVSVPVGHFFQRNNGQIYAYGDWGSLYLYQNGRWNYVENPFENHITAMAESPDSSVWFGVRNEGVYRYDHETFHKYDLPAGLHYDIVHLESTGPETMLLLSADGRLYTSAVDHRFVLLNQMLQGTDPLLPYNTNNQPGIFIQRADSLFRFDKQTWQPNRLPGLSPVLSVRRSEDQSMLITVRDRGIFLRQQKPVLAFIEQAAGFYAEGNLIDNSVGAAFVQVNRDKFPDIFVFNFGNYQLNNLLLNLSGHRFVDISSQSGLDTINQVGLFSFEDFTRDGCEDAVFTTHRSGQNRFKFYRNTTSWRFQRHSEFPISQPELDSPSALEWVTFQGHSTPALFTPFYYTRGRKRGRSFLLENSLGGKFHRNDIPEFPVVYGWNREVKVADFNNDNISDIYVCSFWSPNRILLSEPDHRWIEQIPDTLRTNSNGAVAMDFDMDGDLDIVEQSVKYGVRLFQNDLQGNICRFQLMDSALPPLGSLKITGISTGDFNNDGFPDLLATGVNQSGSTLKVFQNDNGTGFHIATVQTAMRQTNINGTIVGDIDNDGDLDIFGISKGLNRLWINQIDTPDFIKIDLKCSRSPASGRRTKVWLYESGHLADPFYLRGYFQAGTDNFKTNLYNSSTLHFGTGTPGSYDVKVRFVSGKTVVRRQISAGSRIVVREDNPVLAALYLFPGRGMTLLRTPTFYFYGLVFSLAILFTYFGTMFGIRRFHWSSPVAAILILVNSTLFWILLLLLRHEPWVLKYLVPLAVVSGGQVLPLGLSYHLQRRGQRLSGTEARSHLFEVIRQFNHGEWALSTMNSLSLLTRNIGKSGNGNAELENQIQIRGQTFFESILPNLKKIIRYALQSGIKPDVVRVFEHHLTHAETILSQYLRSEPDTGEQARELSRLSVSLAGLKQQLIVIKQFIYSYYSCDVEVVIKRVTDALETQLKDQGMQLNRTRETNAVLWGLIPDSELADIIDNCVNNAIRASTGSSATTLEIQIKKVTPRIHIVITDHGKGIPAELYDRIFENGYSGFQSTGFGLFQARKVLQKYGGRIYIGRSSPGSGTTMIIELNEGIQP